MQDHVLADRLVTYSDAIVAAAFVGMSATSIAIGDPDIRCEFARAPVGIATGNLIIGLLLSGVLWRLRTWELFLRVNEETSDRASRYQRTLSIARHALLWGCILGTVALVAIAARDDLCRIVEEAVA
jgi:hypothetical protein